MGLRKGDHNGTEERDLVAEASSLIETISADDAVKLASNSNAAFVDARKKWKKNREVDGRCAGAPSPRRSWDFGRCADYPRSRMLLRTL